MSKISVVIPCYNQGEYLDEAVCSVLDQTYQNFEIIIVNDGSTDDRTRQILEGYQKPKTRIIHTDNQGLATARNIGIDEASGEYIFPLDADDKIEPELFEKSMAAFERDADIGIVYCEARYFGALDGQWILPEYSKEEILKNNVIFASAVFRKVHWQAVGGYNINMVYGFEDWDFWLALTELGLKVYKIPEVLFHYRIKAQSMVKGIDDEKQFFMRLHTAINHRQLYKNAAELHLLIKVAQLYVDTGVGMNEKQTRSQVVTGDETALLFELSEFSGIKALRFDPYNDFCVVHINKITARDEDDNEIIIAEYQSNASVDESGNLVSITKDPQITIPAPRERLKALSVELNYIAVGKDAFDYLVGHLNDNLNKLYRIIELKDRDHTEKYNEKDAMVRERDKMVADRDKHIAGMDQVVADKDLHIKNLETSLKRIQSSLLYRTINFFRSFFHRSKSEPPQWIPRL